MQTVAIFLLGFAGLLTTLFFPLVDTYSQTSGLDAMFYGFVVLGLGLVRGGVLLGGLLAVSSAGCLDTLMPERGLQRTISAVTVLTVEVSAFLMNSFAADHPTESPGYTVLLALGAAIPIVIALCGLTAVVMGRLPLGAAVSALILVTLMLGGGIVCEPWANWKETEAKVNREAALKQRRKEVAAAPADVAALVKFLRKEEDYGVRRDAADRIVKMENGVERALGLAVGLDADMVDYMKKESHRVRMERAIRELPADAPMERPLALYRDAKFSDFQEKIEERVLASANGGEQLRQALRGPYAFEALVLLGKLPEKGIDRRVWQEACVSGEQLRRDWERGRAGEEPVDSERINQLERAVERIGGKAGGACGEVTK